MGDSSPRRLRAPSPGATAPSQAGRPTPILRLHPPHQIAFVRQPPFRRDFSRTRRRRCPLATVSHPRRPFSSRPFCYSFPAVLCIVATYGHTTQSQDTPHPPQRHRRNFRRGDTLHSRWFPPLLAGLGLHGHLVLVLAHADYVG